MDFTGKVAIVTGAGVGGIGEGIARGLAGAGAKVVIGEIDEQRGRQTAERINEAGGDALAVAMDITDPAQAQAMAEQTVERYGRIDYLVNNAARFRGMDQASLMTIDWTSLQRHLEINLLGGLCVTRAVVPHMLKTGGGGIVWTSSTASWMTGGHYSLAKLGVNSIVLSLAHELGAQNIRVNAIAPGMTDTPGLRDTTPESWIQMGMAQLGIKRFATPQDHAGVVMFLLSDQAAFVNGQIIAVDGASVPRP